MRGGIFMFLLSKDTITKKVIGTVSEKDCPSCKKKSYWELCIVTHWFSILTIPIIPYKKSNCLVCDNCDYCVELSYDEFETIHNEILSSLKRTEPDALKYINKNQLQINYLKTLEASK